MFREKFSELCEHLRPFVSDGTNYPNNRSLSVGEKITCCLHYLKDTEFLQMTANTFGIHRSTISKLIVKVCQALTYNLVPELAHLPSDDEQMEKKTEVKMKFGMLQHFAFINGTYIPILKPRESSKDFFS